MELTRSRATCSCRGVRAAYAFGAMGGAFDQYTEWSKPGVMPLYYIQRFMCLGKQQREREREREQVVREREGW